MAIQPIKKKLNPDGSPSIGLPKLDPAATNPMFDKMAPLGPAFATTRPGTIAPDMSQSVTTPGVIEANNANRIDTSGGIGLKQIAQAGAQAVGNIAGGVKQGFTRGANIIIDPSAQFEAERQQIAAEQADPSSTIVGVRAPQPTIAPAVLPPAALTIAPVTTTPAALAPAATPNPYNLQAGEARIVAPSGQVIQGNAGQMADATNAVQRMARPAIGSTTAGGGTVISGDVERRSGIIGQRPISPPSDLIKSKAYRAGIPSRDERLSSQQIQAAMGLQAQKGATDIRLGEIAADTSRNNAINQAEIRREGAADALNVAKTNAAGRVAAAIAGKKEAGMTSGDAKLYEAKATQITNRISMLESELKKERPGMLGMGGDKEKAKKIQSSIDALNQQLDQHLGGGEGATVPESLPLTGMAPIASARPASAPVKVTSEAEFQKLPSGTMFVDTKGVTRKKP